MDCDSAREAISAQIDGEDPGPTVSVLAAHLTGCAACREWQGRAHAVTRRARLGGSFLTRDLTPRVLAASPAEPSWRRLRLAQRGALIALALAQLAIAAPMLFLGREHGAGVHAAHELGSFNLAIAVAFIVGAIRPKLSAGLAWPCGMAAGGLVTTAVIDLIGGQAIGADEALHLVAFAGAALLVWQSRMSDTGSAGPAVLTGADAGYQEGPDLVRTDAAARLAGPPDRPLGGDAARLAEPDIAARDAGPGASGRAPDEAVA